jgi:hypothetical protein
VLGAAGRRAIFSGPLPVTTPTGEVAGGRAATEDRAGASGLSLARAPLPVPRGRNGGAVTRATSLEAFGADGRGPASSEGEKRTTGAVATSANAPVTASRPITGTTIRVKRLPIGLPFPFGTRLP